MAKAQNGKNDIERKTTLNKYEYIDDDGNKAYHSNNPAYDNPVYDTPDDDNPVYDNKGFRNSDYDKPDRGKPEYDNFDHGKPGQNKPDHGKPESGDQPVYEDMNQNVSDKDAGSIAL